MGFAARIKGFMGYQNEDSYEEEDYPEEAGAQEDLPVAPVREVVLVKPERFDDGRTIAQHIMEGKVVTINMETTNREAARRLLDFIGGATYARDGILSRIATNVYLVTPNGVDYEEMGISGLDATLF